MAIFVKKLMKKIVLLLSVTLFCTIAFCQPAMPENYIKLDADIKSSSFEVVWKTAIFNQALVMFDLKTGKPLMMISLPANGSHSPVAGTYPIMEAKKRNIKKGTQIAKVEYEPGFNSIDSAGTLTISATADGLFTFQFADVAILNSKTNESHKLSFKTVLFIEEK